MDLLSRDALGIVRREQSRPSNIASLFPNRLGAAEDDIVDQAGVQRVSGPQRAKRRRGKFHGGELMK